MAQFNHQALLKALDDLYPDVWPSNAMEIVYEAARLRGIRKSQVKGLFSTVQEAGAFLARKWAQLETRYSRAGALAMATAMIATSPLPGNIALVIAAAEGIRGIAGRKDLEKSSSEDYEDGVAVGENDAVDDISHDRRYNLRMPQSYRDRGQDFERGWRDGYGAYMRRVNYQGARRKQLEQIKSGPLVTLPTSDRFRGVTKALTEAEVWDKAENEWRELLGVK